MTSSRPYLVRALHEWIADNQHTPYVVVDVLVEGVLVPEAYISDGQIVLNVGMSAVRDLQISNKAISFNARFGGVPMDIFVPVEAVLAIYSKETGQGMSFGTEPGPLPPSTPTPDPGAQSNKTSENKGAGGKTAKGRPALKVVK